MNHRIRILETIRQGKVGGGESHLLSLVEQLDKDQFDPIVLSFTDGPMVERLGKMGIPTFIIPSTRAFDPGVWGKVAKLLVREKVDIVHAHGTRAASNIVIPASRLGLPYIYTVHGWSFHDLQPTLVRKLRVMGERFLASKSSANISVSRTNQFTGQKHFPTFRSHVIYNGIDLGRFNPGVSAAGLRPELGIPDDAILAIFIARFEEQKQPWALLRSFAAVSAECPRYHLLMVGEGDHKPKALEMVRELGLEERVSFQPFRQDVPELLSIADIYVLPSLWEGMPIGLLEAMAMGKTILATDVDGTNELVIHGDTGWLINKDQLEPELTKALLGLYADAELRGTLAERARRAVEGRFDAAGMARQVEELYKEQYLLKKRTA